MLNLTSNNSTNINNYNLYESDSNDKYRPPLKKIRLDPVDCPVQKYTANSGRKLAQIIPDNFQCQLNEKSLSDKNIFQLSSESSSEEESCENACWLNALNHAKENGNTKALLKLIHEDKLLESLDAEEMEEIIDFGLIFEKREILIECANSELSADNRLDILIFALDSNDFELTQAICKGTKDFLSRWKWCAEPFLILDSYQANGIDSRIFDFLSSYFSISKSSIEEHSWRKYLAALWNIEGRFSLLNQKIDYQGAQIHLFIDQILSTFKAFWNKNQNAHDLLEILIQLVDESRISINNEARLYTFKKHLPVMIHGGYPEHHMEIVLWDHYLLICNKGGLSEMPVKVYTINPDLVNAELFKKITNCSDKFKEEDAAKFYASTLPEMLNGIQHEVLSNLFTEKWIDASLEQEGDNCVWESLRTALFGVAGLNAWIKNGCENTLDSEIHAQTITDGLVQLLPWDQYVGLFSLEQYIDFSASDPTAMDRKLVISVLNKAKELMHDKKMNNFHYEEVVAKFVRTRTKAIEIENANDLVMDVEGI